MELLIDSVMYDAEMPSYIDEIEGVTAWYLRTAYGRWEGPGVLPFYADARRVGRFAVDLSALGERDPDAIFQLLITLASYQARRDIDIMAIQRAMAHRRAADMTSTARLRVLVDRSRCLHLRDGADAFDQRCNVRRDLERGITTCDTHPRTPCHVKDATTAIGRMGDFGKLPTSAWLHIGSSGLHRWLIDICSQEKEPHARGARLVDRVSTIYRIGRKLASMFVSALSVAELGGPAPWRPDVDGSRILVVDANVAAAIRIWRRERGANSYEGYANWLLIAANRIDLSALREDLPRSSPRLVQQAVYLFRSRSNRVALGDECATVSCRSCPSRICPFRVT